MASEDQNPRNDFMPGTEDPDRNQTRPTIFSFLSGYLASLVLILVLSLIVGLLLFFRLLAHHLYPYHFIYWPFLDRSNDHTLAWGAAILIGGSLLYGLWVWFTGIFEEIRTRHALERHAWNSQLDAGKTPLGRLLDRQIKDEIPPRRGRHP